MAALSGDSEDPVLNAELSGFWLPLKLDKTLSAAASDELTETFLYDEPESDDEHPIKKHVINNNNIFIL